MLHKSPCGANCWLMQKVLLFPLSSSNDLLEWSNRPDSPDCDPPRYLFTKFKHIFSPYHTTVRPYSKVEKGVTTSLNAFEVSYSQGTWNECPLRNDTVEIGLGSNMLEMCWPLQPTNSINVEQIGYQQLWTVILVVLLLIVYCFESVGKVTHEGSSRWTISRLV
jgi:hypothetical protein